MQNAKCKGQNDDNEMIFFQIIIRTLLLKFIRLNLVLHELSYNGPLNFEL